MAVKFSPIFNSQVVDDSGNPAVGWKIETYVAGSSTLAPTYTTSLGNVAQTNPIVINALGFPTTGQIWLTEGVSYKLVLTNAAGTVQKTEDNISGVNDTSSSTDQWVAGPSPTYVSAAVFTLVGDQTSTFSIGRRVKTTNTGGTIYGTITNSVFGVATTVTIKTDSGTLDSGLSAVSYGLISASNPSTPAATINAQPVCNGRLTLETGVAVSTANQTAKTSVYFTPYQGNTVDLYDGSANWNRYTFSELTLAVPATTAQLYDVFLQNNAGTLQLNAVAWTNDTTRATALVLQNGVLVRTGATSQRYLGSFRTTAAAGQTEDSTLNRFLWNYYNRILRNGLTTYTAARSTASATYAELNTEIQFHFIIGVSEDGVLASSGGSFNASGGTCTLGLAFNSATVAEAGFEISGVNSAVGDFALVISGVKTGLAVGKHYLTLLGMISGANTLTVRSATTNAASKTYLHCGISG